MGPSCRNYLDGSICFYLSKLFHLVEFIFNLSNSTGGKPGNLFHLDKMDPCKRTLRKCTQPLILHLSRAHFMRKDRCRANASNSTCLRVSLGEKESKHEMTMRDLFKGVPFFSQASRFTDNLSCQCGLCFLLLINKNSKRHLKEFLLFVLGLYAVATVFQSYNGGQLT